MSRSWLSPCKEIASSLLELIYPSVCAGCGREMPGQDALICSDCLHQIPRIQPPLCPQCGAPLSAPPDPTGKRCRFCPPGPHFFQQSRSLYSYKDPRVKNLVHALKFRYQTGVAAPLSRLLSYGFDFYFSKMNIDALAPVPLHKSRLREREFNQAALLCGEISRRRRIPIREDLVYRRRRTPPQASLHPETRMKNLEDAFFPVEENAAAGLRVLIVDDVMTTGATINAVSKALRRAGAEAVFALTLALTIDLPARSSDSL
ncbi:MAG: ComF family protein [Candidatus Omnitrophica bacterium]|nr:ComF family protein [Candidatus Omnitrophota bacterium]